MEEVVENPKLENCGTSSAFRGIQQANAEKKIKASKRFLKQFEFLICV